MADLLRVKVGDLKNPELLKEKLQQAHYLAIIQIEFESPFYVHLIRFFQDLGIKKIYVEYSEIKYLYYSGQTQHQVRWIVQYWRHLFPELEFEVLNHFYNTPRWEGLKSARWPYLILKSVLKVTALGHLILFHVCLPVNRTIAWLKKLWFRIRWVWGTITFENEYHRMMTWVHKISRPLKKTFYFLKYLWSKFSS